MTEYDGLSISFFVEVQKLKRLGYVLRMEDCRTVKNCRVQGFLYQESDVEDGTEVGGETVS